MKQNENYEKKYKEALNRASHIKDYNTIGTPQEIAELIFPELRENLKENRGNSSKIPSNSPKYTLEQIVEGLGNGTWNEGYFPTAIEKHTKLEQAAKYYTYLIPQTFEERVEMYMKCEKKTLAEMLAMRDVILYNQNPPQNPILTRTE